MIALGFLTDENFIMQTGVAIHSIIANKNKDTRIDIFVIAAECGEKAMVLKKMETEDVHITIREASLEQYRDVKQLAHIPIACLLKFNICDLIPEYDKLLYLDGDIIVRGDLTEAYNFDLGDYYLAAVPSVDNLAQPGRRFIDAGVVLFDAKKMRDEKKAEQLVEARKSLGDRGSMDQQTFNLIMSEQTTFLPCIYNCVANRFTGASAKSYPIEKMNSLFGTDYKSHREMIDSAVIIHFATGDKPWKYKYVACADEWYNEYLSSPFGNEKLNRKSALSAHAGGVARNFRKGGTKRVFGKIVKKIKKLCGKAQTKGWE